LFKVSQARAAATVNDYQLDRSEQIYFRTRTRAYNAYSLLPAAHDSFVLTSGAHCSERANDVPCYLFLDSCPLCGQSNSLRQLLTPEPVLCVQRWDRVLPYCATCLAKIRTHPPYTIAVCVYCFGWKSVVVTRQEPTKAWLSRCWQTPPPTYDYVEVANTMELLGAAEAPSPTSVRLRMRRRPASPGARSPAAAAAATAAASVDPIVIDDSSDDDGDKDVVDTDQGRMQLDFGDNDNKLDSMRSESTRSPETALTTEESLVVDSYRRLSSATAWITGDTLDFVAKVYIPSLVSQLYGGDGDIGHGTELLSGAGIAFAEPTAYSYIKHQHTIDRPYSLKRYFDDSKWRVLFVPMHVNSGTHWCLAVVVRYFVSQLRVPGVSIALFDSLPSSQLHDPLSCQSSPSSSAAAATAADGPRLDLLRALAIHRHFLLGGHFHCPAFYVPVPCQRDGHSCGIFAAYYMALLSNYFLSPTTPPFPTTTVIEEHRQFYNGAQIKEPPEDFRRILAKAFKDHHHATLNKALLE
jgi:hypothetical protein